MSRLQETWVFQHQIFALTDENRTSVKVSRYSHASSQVVGKKHDQQVIEIGSHIEDIVYDSKYKLLFILTDDCKAHVFLGNQTDRMWCSVTTLELSAQHKVLRGKAVCLLNHIYWQGYTGEERHSSTIVDTEYRVSLGVDAGIAGVNISHTVEIFVGCPPCLLYTFGNQTILAVPQSVRLKSLAISITVAKVTVSHVTCGVIASCDHLLTPVKFVDVAIPITSALKACDEAKDCVIKSTICDGQKLYIMSTNSIWELSSITNTFIHLDLNVASVPLEVDVWLLRNCLVWLNTEASSLWYIDIYTNTVYSKSIGELADSWCYDTDNRNVLLCSGEHVLSVSKLLDVGERDMSQTSNLITNDILTPPDCLQSMNDKVLSLLPQAGYSKYLITSAPNQVKSVPTRLCQEMGHLAEEHMRRGVDQTARCLSMAVTVDGVVNMLSSLTIDNLCKTVSTLRHFTDIARQTCFNAFNRFLIQQEPAVGLLHWRLLFTSTDPRANTPPLVTLYLRIVWLLYPQTIVNAVLMVGCKSKECLQTSSAPTIYIDSLLDTIDLMDKDRLKSRLLLYAQLSMLSASEGRVLLALSLLSRVGIDISKLIESFGEGCERRRKLAEQYLSVIDIS